jgi:hypothetical protein
MGVVLMKKIILFISCISLLSIYTGFTEDENLLEDPSFENLEDIKLDVGTWRVSAYNMEPGSTEFMIETGGAHTGEKFVTIINHRENHSRFVQRIGVQGGKIYRLSCWAKTENVGTETKGANITEEGILDHSPSVSGTTGSWVYTEMYLKIGKEIDNIAVAVSLGGYYGTNTGKASFDDITVEEVTEIPEDAVIATKGEYVEKETGKKKDEEQPVRIVKVPGPMNIPLLIAVILGIACAAYIVGRIVYINIKKKKIPEKKESKEEKPEQEIKQE